MDDRDKAPAGAAPKPLAPSDQTARADAADTPPATPLVYCCATLGWVTPVEAAEHQYESSFGWDNSE